MTHNGGSSWHRVRQVPGYTTDLEASAGVVYAASTVTRSGKQEIYSSPAGSDSWKPVNGLPKAAGSGGLGEITLHGKAGWVILGRRLYATQNGCRWTKEGFACRAGYGIASVGAFSAKQLTLLCAGDAALGSTRKVLYASSDGGAHFTRVGSPPRGGDGGLLAEPTPKHVFVASASGASFIYVSADGGHHWRTARTFDDGGLGWNDFGFTTATQGVAVEGTSAFGTTHPWLTRNAGGTWQTVKF